MIKLFKHKGLKRLFEKGHTSGVNPQHVERLRKNLELLEISETIDDMGLPDYAFASDNIRMEEDGSYLAASHTVRSA